MSAPSPSPAPPPPEHPATVHTRRVDAPGIETLVLDYDTEHLRYRAGQAFRLNLEPGRADRTYSRPFSVASSPSESQLLFTTRIRAESPFKQRWLELRSGDALSVRGPRGEFLLPDDPTIPVAFLGGGIGVTPFRSMARYATDARLEHRITFLYSCRSAEEILFRSDWQEMTARNPRLRFVPTITRALESDAPWAGERGRIDADLLRAHVPEPQRSRFYLCGVPAFVDAMRALVLEIGADPQAVRADTFKGYAFEAG